MKSDLIDIEVYLVFETSKAILVSDEELPPMGASSRKVEWLPKSKIEYGRVAFETVTTVTLPEWLANEKGLI